MDSNLPEVVLGVRVGGIDLYQEIVLGNLKLSIMPGSNPESTRLAYQIINTDGTLSDWIELHS